MCSRTKTTKAIGNCSEQIRRLKYELEDADAIVIGAGAGLSTSAGLTYDRERFDRYFSDFREKYGIADMYSGGFYPFETPEEYWAWWSRQVFVNRYGAAAGKPYTDLLELVKDKDYFVITTNVDHQFQLAGFDKERLFYTQGDYGLFQCSEPCHAATYENEDAIRDMVEAQGYAVDDEGELLLPKGVTPKMAVPSVLVPNCPKCGKPMTMNLRCDDSFVQDEGWYDAANRYAAFLRGHDDGRLLFLELGVGANTPGIIKYPFWRMTAENPEAVYACLNLGEACAPKEIADRSLCIDEDIGETLQQL